MSRVVFALLLLVYPGSSAMAQVIIGNCNSIITLRFEDERAVAAYFGDISNFTVWVERIRQLVLCAREVDDPRGRMVALLVSLKAVVKLKRMVLLPAFDRFISNPTEGNREAALSMAQLTKIQVEQALIETLKMVAQLELAPGSLGNIAQEADGNLSEMTAMLQDKLVQRLQGPLAQLNSLQVNQSLRIFRDAKDNYVRILSEMDSLIEQLEQKLPKQ